MGDACSGELICISSVQDELDAASEAKLNN